MRELELRTLRVRRSLLERLRGYDRVYDGERADFGRGASREASQAALRNWNAKSRDLDTREAE